MPRAFLVRGAVTVGGIWPVTSQFSIDICHLSSPSFGQLSCTFWHGWTGVEHTLWGGFRYFYNRKLDWYISFPHLCGEWDVICKSYLFAIWWNLLTFRRKNKKVLASVATVSWRDFPRKKGLAFLLHKRNLSDDTLGFRISVAWRRTIWSLHQLGHKMQLGHGQRIVFPKCVTFSDFSRTKYDIRVIFSFLD